MNPVLNRIVRVLYSGGAFFLLVGLVLFALEQQVNAAPPSLFQAGDSAVRFDQSDTSWCQFEPVPIQVTGSYQIPEGREARLQVTFQITSPNPSGKEVLDYGKVSGNGTFSLTRQWPGSDPNLAAVTEVQFTATLLDPDTGAPISSEASLRYTCNPANCPGLTPSVPPCPCSWTATPSPTATGEPNIETLTPTETREPRPSRTPTPTETRRPRPTRTPTEEQPPTDTPTVTQPPPADTETPTPTATEEQPGIETFTPTVTQPPPVDTETPTPTATQEQPGVETFTPTVTQPPPVDTETATPTNTLPPPADTETPTPTATQEQPNVETATPTNTQPPPVNTATATPTNTQPPPPATNTPTTPPPVIPTFTPTNTLPPPPPGTPLTLSHVCGYVGDNRMFWQVVNSSGSTVSFTWDSPSGESGSGAIGPNSTGYFSSASNSQTVRIYINGQLVAQQSAGGACLVLLSPTYVCTQDNQIAWFVNNNNSVAVGFNWTLDNGPSGGLNAQARESKFVTFSPPGAHNFVVTWEIPPLGQRLVSISSDVNACQGGGVVSTPTSTPTATNTQVQPGVIPTFTLTPTVTVTATVPSAPGVIPTVTLTPTRTLVPTLAQPQATQTPILIPVTGVDLTPAYKWSFVSRIFVNLGMLFMGVAFLITAATFRPRK